MADGFPLKLENKFNRFKLLFKLLRELILQATGNVLKCNSQHSQQLTFPTSFAVVSCIRYRQCHAHKYKIR